MKSIFLVLLLSISATAQSPQKNCDFLSFDRELRDALSSADMPARISLLVNYPLRVNDSGGSFYIEDAASLHGHFSEIFTPIVRKAILEEHFDADYCGAYRAIYGLGEAVVNLSEHGYRIGSINTSTADEKPKVLVGRVEFVCRTDKNRMVVDNQANGNLRLRAWNSGKSLSQTPDLVITSGKEETQGTSPCTHSVWTFQSGATKYSLSENGCFPDSNQPPAGAHGQFSIDSGQKKDESWSWCY